MRLEKWRHKIEYTNDKLKVFLREAWNAEVSQKEKELERPLTDDEKKEIKITTEHINLWHEAGRIPSLGTFLTHFDSIYNIAALLDLPVAQSRSPVSYYEGDKSLYINLVRTYIKEFEKQNNRRPSRLEITEAIRGSNISGVPTTLLQYVNIFNIFGIGKASTGHSENIYSDDDMIRSVTQAFEIICKQEARKQGKEVLAPEERQKLKLKGVVYEALRKSGVLTNAPAAQSIITRLGKEFGPSWNDVLQKVGIPD